MELLTRQIVCDILDGKGNGRVPVWYDYFAEETRRRYGARIDDILERYQDDFVVLTREDEEWGSSTAHADGGVGSLPDELILQDWEQLGRFLRHKLACEVGHCELRPYSLTNWEYRNNRYAVGHWWYGYSENLSLLRGPLNALTDVLLEPEQVNRLFDGLEEYFLQLIHIFKNRYDTDAIWIGDDYGMQDRSMYSSDVFRSLFKHRLRTLADIAHAQGMKFFLHSCGNVEMLIPDLIDAGIDLIHPIQPGVMDARKLVDEFGKDIGFFMGMDVQNILSFGTPQDVASHVDEQFRIFRSARRGVIASMANTIMPETPWENIESLFASLQRNAAGKM